jgi:hypothetical protein
MKQETIPMKDIMIAIPLMPKLAEALLGKGKVYDALLTEILKYDYFSDDHHFFTPKELQQKLNLSYAQFRKQIHTLYDDFMGSISGPDTALCLGDKLCEFYVHYFQKRVVFYARLSEIPRIGEQMQFPFIRPIIGHDLFRVQRVTHGVLNDRQDFEIWLTPGEFNLYDQFEKDKAKSEGRYDWMNDRIIADEKSQRQVAHNTRHRKFW